MVVKPGHALAEAQLCEFLQARIARFKTPRRWQFRETPLPKTGTGKIVKRIGEYRAVMLGVGSG